MHLEYAYCNRTSSKLDHYYFGILSRMAVKPVVLPEFYNGKTLLDEWSVHFDNIVEVNEWIPAQKLKWLKVQLMGCSQNAFQHLPEDSQATSDAVQKTLKERFEPEC